ncbi:hypothetical protein CEXT_585361 [Caerostris extrusa]|uniref:Uncharacterized protein n=1 Tax=Caerostris extrusa TaxID=172846 RepID=A0AAV4Q753_CAEEX|nr:hypothetical protein CEXT_585361 [Caerostris extrusa]
MHKDGTEREIEPYKENRLTDTGTVTRELSRRPDIRWRNRIDKWTFSGLGGLLVVVAIFSTFLSGLKVVTSADAANGR